MRFGVNSRSQAKSGATNEAEKKPPVANDPFGSEIKFPGVDDPSGPKMQFPEADDPVVGDPEFDMFDPTILMLTTTIS